jgi:hypothetical protein
MSEHIDEKPLTIKQLLNYDLSLNDKHINLNDELVITLSNVDDLFIM